MFNYPIVLAPDDNDTVLVTCPDLPEVVTFGDDEAEALVRAVDAIETALIGRISDKQDIPLPSRPAKGQATVQLPPMSVAKIGLYQAMRAQGIKKADLARSLGVNMPQVDRLLDLRHASKLEQIEAALRAVGKVLAVEIKDAA